MNKKLVKQLQTKKVSMAKEINNTTVRNQCDHKMTKRGGAVVTTTQPCDREGYRKCEVCNKYIKIKPHEMEDVNGAVEIINEVFEQIKAVLPANTSEETIKELANVQTVLGQIPSIYETQYVSKYVKKASRKFNTARITRDDDGDIGNDTVIVNGNTERRYDKHHNFESKKNKNKNKKHHHDKEKRREESTSILSYVE